MESCIDFSFFNAVMECWKPEIPSLDCAELSIYLCPLSLAQLVVEESVWGLALAERCSSPTHIHSLTLPVGPRSQPVCSSDGHTRATRFPPSFFFFYLSDFCVPSVGLLQCQPAAVGIYHSNPFHILNVKGISVLELIPASQISYWTKLAPSKKTDHRAGLYYVRWDIVIACCLLSLLDKRNDLKIYSLPTRKKVCMQLCVYPHTTSIHTQNRFPHKRSPKQQLRFPHWLHVFPKH